MGDDGDRVVERELEVTHALGLHARVAARIAEAVQALDCRVTLGKDGREADAASVLSVLTLDAPAGSTLTVRAQGPQAEEAVATLARLLTGDFGDQP